MRGGYGDRARAQEIYKRILREYPDSEVADIVRTCWGKVEEQPLGEEEAEALAKLSSTPNPFNPYTVLRFELPQSDRVKLSIYNVLGQQVTILVNEIREAGTHAVVWDGRDERGIALGSGLYFVRLEAGSTVHKRKLLLLK